MKIKSGMTNRDVDFDDNIIVVNSKQAAFYWGEKKIQPVHVYPSLDNRTGEPIIVFVFRRSETYSAYQEWKDRKPVIT